MFITLVPFVYSMNFGHGIGVFYVGVDLRVFPIKFSSNDDPGLKQGFGVFASLPLAQGTFAVYKKCTKFIGLLSGIDFL